jgi:hypothetical protein
MNQDNAELLDDLEPEYDLTTLNVRRLGSGRKSFGGVVVRLEPDVAEIFPNAEAVNEALRFLARVAKEQQIPIVQQQANEAV